MNDRVEDIFKKVQDVGLSSSEKLAMRQSLLEMMGRTPAVAAPERSPMFANFLEHARSLPRLFSRPALASFLAFGMLLTGSGISYAAEGALPGEPLYSVKVNVNETVRDLLAISSEAKATWAAERVERRLEEVEVLTAASQIDPVETDKLQRVIQEQTRVASERLDRLAGSGDHAAAVVVGTELEKRLQKHQDRMTRMSRHRVREDREVLDTLAESVGEETEDLVQKNELNEDALAETEPELAAPAAVGRLNDSEAKLREARELLDDRDRPEASLNGVKQDLDRADGLLDEGKKAMEDGDLPKAFSKFREAHRRARAASELMEETPADQGRQQDRSGSGGRERSGGSGGRESSPDQGADGRAADGASGRGPEPRDERDD